MKVAILILCLLATCGATVAQSVGGVLASQKISASAALSRDDVQTGSSTATSSVSFTLTTTGANRLVIAAVSYYDFTSATITATYNSVSLTVVPSSVAHGSSQQNTAILYLINPASGAHTLTVNTPFNFSCVAGYAYSNANQTTPTGTAVTATGTSTTPSVTVSSAVGQEVVDIASASAADAHSGTPGAGQTEWMDIDNSSNLGLSSTETGAASVVMSWTISSTNWASSAVGIIPA